MPVDVSLEVGAKRVFASALEWPGWCRSAKDEDAALDNLRAYGDRYAPVARAAGQRWPRGVADGLVVVERLPGSATTDFGAPGAIGAWDRRGLTAREAQRVAAPGYAS